MKDIGIIITLLFFVRMLMISSLSNTHIAILSYSLIRAVDIIGKKGWFGWNANGYEMGRKESKDAKNNLKRSW